MTGRQPSMRKLAVILVAASAVAYIAWRVSAPSGSAAAAQPPAGPESSPAEDDVPATARRRVQWDSSGYRLVYSHAQVVEPTASLEEIRDSWRRNLRAMSDSLDRRLVDSSFADGAAIEVALTKASLLNFEGAPRDAYDLLSRVRLALRRDAALRSDWFATIVFAQGITALRIGESENCVECGCGKPSMCILPIAGDAVHERPEGSRLAIRHFTEYLRIFPDDFEVRWLLNLAHMTLGGYPDGVDPRFLIPLDRFRRSEFDIGRFHDVAHEAGVDRENEAGGAIMEDFDGDGLLDIVVTSIDPGQSMCFWRNRGDGTFEDRTDEAGIAGQMGGLYCVQADYDNDGSMDIFVARGAWLTTPLRPTLLRNDGSGRFADVTREAGLMEPVNSNSAQWADYDNDGWVDLFVCCEAQPNRLYRNRGDGTFEEVAGRAGVQGTGRMYKGCAWIQSDGDRFPDLFVTALNGPGHFFRNRGNGTFGDASLSAGIDGPAVGFSCWAFDYDNDGLCDIFATSYDRTLEDIVKGLIGEPHARRSNRLFRNRGGGAFEDATKEAGLDLVFATMGSNYGDFDNDGFLDMYLATGDPDLMTLVPNRMLRNIGGKRFAEVTGSSGTGHLQKGHGVACGDYDRDGDVDLFVEMGGAVDGDRFRNALFRNPGQGGRSITVKLFGRKTNRAAIGARIKIVTPGGRATYRHVSSGSSFGANPMEQTIGLGDADRVTLLEVHWPTSGTTQTFHDIAAGQMIRITEFEERIETVAPREPPPR